MSGCIRVLLVEDNPADVDLVREELSATGPAGFQVESAPRLSAGLARLEAGGIDLVLLDLGLPDSQGLDTFRRLRDAEPRVPVIVLTGNVDQTIGLAAVGEGAQDYLLKGEVTGESVARSIRHAIKRRRAEEALRASEERLSLALEATRDGIYDVDFRAGTTYHSPAYLAMLGYDPRELAFSPESGIWESLLHPDDKQVALETLNRCLSGETGEYDMEFRLRTKTGDWRWIESRGRLVSRDPKGNPGRLVGSHRDITERRQAEEALRNSEERFRTLYANIPIGLYRAAPDGAILLANPAFVKMLGFSSTDHFMMTDLSADGFAPSYPRSQFMEGMEKNGTVTGLEATWTRRDGTTLMVRESARAIRDADGKILYFDGTVEDITERRQAEEALSRSESMFRSLFESMAEGAALHEIVCGADGKAVDYRIVDVNPSYEVHTGITQERARGRLATEVYMTDAAPYLDIYERVARTGESHSFETYYPPLDKSFSISAYSPKRGWFATVFADITERARREREVADAKALLQASIESPKGLVIMAVDREYRYLCLNTTHAAAMQSAYGKSVVVGMNVLDCISSAVDRQSAKTNYDRAMAGEPHSTVQEYGDIERSYYETFYSPIFDNRNEIIGITAFARDITERMEAEERLKSQLEELQRWEAVMVDREDRVREIKCEVNELCRRVGEPVRYPSQEGGSADSEGSPPKP